jgi:AraC-like DNA-binding protein
MIYRDLAARVLCYLTANYMESIDMTHLEAYIGASRFTMTRAFKHVYGLPPLRFLWKFRVMMATRMLLAKTRMRNEEIAHRCGFQTSPHFQRVYKRVTGHTPRDMRHFSACEIWLANFHRKMALPSWLEPTVGEVGDFMPGLSRR